MVVCRHHIFLTLKVTEPEFQSSQVKQAHDEGSQSHAVAGELGTLSDFRDQAVQDPGRRTDPSRDFHHIPGVVAALPDDEIQFMIPETVF